MSVKNNNRLNRIDEELKKEISTIINYELKFVLDDSMEYGAKIDQILKEIMPISNKEDNSKENQYIARCVSSKIVEEY